MSYLAISAVAALKVLVVALLLGAGLPLVYAVGLRALAIGDGDSPGPRRSPALGRALFGVSLLIVLAGVGLGLTYVIASSVGQHLVFDGVLPHLVARH